jgi:hypothetical protein
VSEVSSEALRLYRRSRFRDWGTEPDALRHEGRTVSTRHMSLEL